MRYATYDIVLVNFPFTNLQRTKLRPSLVLKQLEGDNTIFCLITTKQHSLSKYEVQLLKSACEGDIRFDSHIYVDTLFTLHKNLAEARIGFIKDKQVQQQIDRKLQLLFSK